MLLVAVASALALQAAGLYLPPLRELLGTRPLTVADLAITSALSAFGYAAVRLDRILHPGRLSPPGRLARTGGEARPGPPRSPGPGPRHPAAAHRRGDP
jgi:Ca2+-transporting ATPase